MRQYNALTMGVVAACALCVLTAGGIAGCGGGQAALAGGSGSTSSGSRSSKAQVTIDWPPVKATKSTARSQGRVIPNLTLSIRITITDNSKTVWADRLVVNPLSGSPSTVTISNLPASTPLTLTATAFAYADGTGDPLAAVTSALGSLAADVTTPLAPITLNSTITTLQVASLPIPQLSPGQTYQLSVTPTDAQQRMVLVPAGNITWSTLNAAVATVNPATGLVTGVQQGTTTIQVTEKDSGVTASAPVTVVPAITISPTTQTIPTNGVQAFTATVTGAVNTAVNWSIQEGAIGGTISANGSYIASNTPGTYHIVATSVADGKQTAVAIVTVQAGSLAVVVQ